MKQIKNSILTTRLSFFIVFLCSAFVFTDCRRNESIPKSTGPGYFGDKSFDFHMLINDYTKGIITNKNAKTVKSQTDIADNMDID